MPQETDSIVSHLIPALLLPLGVILWQIVLMVQLQTNHPVYASLVMKGMAYHVLKWKRERVARIMEDALAVLSALMYYRLFSVPCIQRVVNVGLDTLVSLNECTVSTN